jgi:hypothetical protein
MKSPELFRVFHKIIGVFYLVKGFSMLPYARHELHQFDDSVSFFYMAMGGFAGPAVMICFGYWLLVSKEWFMQLAYPHWVGMERMSQPTSHENFTVLLKSVGVWEFVGAVSGLPLWIAYAHANLDRNHAFGLIMESFVPPATALALGCVLFFKTESVVRVAFLWPLNWDEHGNGKGGNASRTVVELFVAIQKTQAILLVMDGLVNLVYAFPKANLFSDQPPEFFMLLDIFALPAILLVAGCWLFFATNFFVRLAYSEQSSDN